jgi:hypothetical protein
MQTKLALKNRQRQKIETQESRKRQERREPGKSRAPGMSRAKKSRERQEHREPRKSRAPRTSRARKFKSTKLLIERQISHIPQKSAHISHIPLLFLTNISYTTFVVYEIFVKKSMVYQIFVNTRYKACNTSAVSLKSLSFFSTF